MAGADLANLVNEAALGAARRGEQSVARQDFGEALERIILGSERRLVLSPLERERTAYHESGHALLGMLQPGADPVRKITIVPRGQALGVTYQSPTSDRYGYAQSYLRGRIVGALGGRAAEELIYHETTTGPESDLEQATAIARQMVGRWGMSEAVGPVSVLPRDGQQAWPGDPSGPRTRPASWSTTRCDASSTTAPARRASCWPTTATSSTLWPAPCWSARRSRRRRPTRSRGSDTKSRRSPAPR